MPKLRWYRLFISHAWQYNDEYYRLEDYLNAAPHFQWQNLSVPEHDPVRSGDAFYLADQLNAQMRSADAFIIISGMYANHSGWIQYELDYADSISRPIIAIRPWGAQRLPQKIQEMADEIVGWNTNSIVDAIRRWALPTGG